MFVLPCFSPPLPLLFCFGFQDEKAFLVRELHVLFTHTHTHTHTHIKPTPYASPSETLVSGNVYPLTGLTPTPIPPIPILGSLGPPFIFEFEAAAEYPGVEDPYPRD